MTSDRTPLEEMAASAEVRVADVIRRAAASRPQVVALRHGERELTYVELHERSSRLAQALLGRGIAAGGRIAYLGRAAPEVIELLFAASKIGAVIVPLNWRLSPRELCDVVADAGAPLLIVDSAYLETAHRLIGRVGEPDRASDRRPRWRTERLRALAGRARPERPRWTRRRR